MRLPEIGEWVKVTINPRLRTSWVWAYITSRDLFDDGWRLTVDVGSEGLFHVRLNSWTYHGSREDDTTANVAQSEAVQDALRRLPLDADA